MKKATEWFDKRGALQDLDHIVIHTNFTNTIKQITTLTLDDLLTPAGQQHLRNVFRDSRYQEFVNTNVRACSCIWRSWGRGNHAVN